MSGSRLRAVAVLVAFASASAAYADGVADLPGVKDPNWKPDAAILAKREAFADKKFGIFIHFGLFSMYAQDCWYLQSFVGREADYARGMHAFYPSKFNAKEWVRVIKASGAKYCNLTARHHDGFSMWPTKVDDGYNVANTPFKRDIVGELAKACEEEGIELHLYYSLMDWHRKDYPTGTSKRIRETIPDRREDYDSYYKFMVGQLNELLDWYKPGCIWFDAEGDHSPRNPKTHKREPNLDYRFDEMYDLIHAKGAMVINNIGQEPRPKEDAHCYECNVAGTKKRYFKMATDRPVEHCDQIQKNAWGYNLNEKTYRTPEDVVKMLAMDANVGANLLLNVGPYPDGSFPPDAVETLLKVGEWLEKYGESIYGTRRSEVRDGFDVVGTKKGDKTTYLHFLNPETTRFTFEPEGEIASVTYVGSGAPVRVESTSGGDETIIQIERAGRGVIDVPVKVVYK